MRIFLKILLLTCLSLSLVLAKLPADVKKCKPTDKNCILENINHIFQTKLNGDPEFGLLKLKSVDVGDLVMKQDENNPISLETTLKNVNVHGIENMRALKIKGFGNQPDGVYEFLLKAPVLSMLGDYKLNGKILILPVTGEGKMNITFVESVTKLKFQGKSLNKDGQLYLNVTSLDLEGSQKRVIYYFDNLFNGNKVLADQFNAFINQEWELLQNEFFAPITNLFQKTAFKIVKNVFNSTPFNEIFIISE